MAGPNVLDRTISWFSPERGLKRARARALSGLVRGYDAAKGRRRDGWYAVGSTVNAEIATALPHLRSNARELDRNNPLTRRAADVLVSTIIGTGIQPTPVGRSAKRVKKAFEAWSRVCDADGRHDIYGLQALAVRTMIVSGAAVIRKWPRSKSTSRGPVPLQIQVLEPDYIDMGRSEATPSGGWILQGVEFDSRGNRVAYWLFNAHPGEADAFYGRDNLISRRVPAEDVIHLYRVDRPGQIHGVPWASSVAMAVRDIAEYEEAERVRKKIEACSVGIVTSADGTAAPIAPSRVDDKGNRIDSFEPGMWSYLNPGEDVKFNSPSVSGGYAEYIRTQHRTVATGFGIMYEQLTGDLSNINYSSYKAGDLVARSLTEAMRWQTIIPVACDPIWSWFTFAAALAGVIPDESVPATHSPPRFQSIDPQKDAEADLLDIRMGTKTWSQAVAERGYDPDQQVDEIAADQKRFDEAGIILDSDPRNQARNGNKAGTPAAADPPKG